MRKAVWSTAALVLLLSGAGVIMASPLHAADQNVTMVDGSGDPMTTWKFEPATITVASGTKVTWKNTGDQPHTATADDGSFDSGYLSNGKEFSTVVTKTVKYKCEPHPWMIGTINVTGGAPSAGGGESSTTTTAPTSATTAPGGQSTTTTTGKAAAGDSTTTTAAPAGAATTPTTAPPSVTPTSAPDSAGVTSTTIAQGEEAAADGHADEESESRKDKDDEDSSPIGIAFAGISTLLLAAISGKLLSSKS